MITRKFNNLLQLLPTKHSSVKRVRLKLTTHSRNIGIIDFSGEGNYMKEIKLFRHKFHKGSSIGFCYELLKSYTFRWIRIHCDDGKILETSRKFVLASGTIKDFKRAGFEKQIFLPIEMFGHHKARRWEQQNNQTELFDEVA